MGIPKFYIQCAFSKTGETAVKRLYGICDDEKILCAVWISSDAENVYARKGFVFTDSALYWKHPATAETTDANVVPKEITPKNESFLAKSSVTFLGTDVKTSDEAARMDNSSVITLRSSGVLYTFLFDSAVRKESLCDLERLVAKYFSDVLNLNDFSDKDDSYSLQLTLLTIKDFFVQTALNIKQKLAGFKADSKARRAEKQAQNQSARAETSEETSGAGETAKPEKQVAPRFLLALGRLFRHIIDFLADLLFVCGVVIFVKPALLEAPFFEIITEHIGVIRLKIWISSLPYVASPETLYLRNTIFIGILVFYVILKVFISLSCRKNRKAVTFLLLAMLVAASLLIADKFLVFAILALLILLALQFSMGFSTKSIKIKSLCFVVASVAGYFILHLIMFPEMLEIFDMLHDILYFSPNWW